MVIFGDFFKQLGTKRGPVHFNSQLGTLQDVRDYKNRNHNDGAIVGYLKGPKRAPKRKNEFFFHCDYKNEWNDFKFEMEVPYRCNYHHVKICGPPQMASQENLATKPKIAPKKSVF